MDEGQSFLKKIGCNTKRSLFLPCLILLVITLSKMCFSTLEKTEIRIVPISNELQSEDSRNIRDGLFKLSAGSRHIPAKIFSDDLTKVDFRDEQEDERTRSNVEADHTDHMTTYYKEGILKGETFRSRVSSTQYDGQSSIIQTQTESSRAPSIDEQFHSYMGEGNNKEIISWTKRFKKKPKPSSLSFNERRALMENTLPYNPKDVDLMSLARFHYMESYKNPCWLETSAGGNYTDSFYTTRPDVQQDLRLMKNIFHNRQKNGDFHRVRCLPYFLIIGQPKCGSTDLYRKIIAHPEVRNLPVNLKEPHWWARARLGRHSARGHTVSLENYIDLFDHVSYQIEMDTTLDDTSNVFHHLVTGEGSMSTFWDNDHWWALVGNENLTEPRVLVPDYIHHLLPDVKLILILRNPTTRMYSDFLYFRKDRKSPDDFHEAVVQAVRLYQDCFQKEPLRTCVYNYFLNFKAQIRLRVGLYSVFLKDWLRVFSRKQIFIIRTEDYASNLRDVLLDLFHFMDLRQLTSDEEEVILSLKRANTRRKGDLKYGDMLPQTRTILDDFYRSFNEELADILNDESFLWQDDFL